MQDQDPTTTDRPRLVTKLNRQYHRWHSSALDREMELLVFGHTGARVLVFPTSQGHFYDWEDRGMIDALSDHLDRGWIQMFCVDSVDQESWYNATATPAQRALRHAQYDQYLLEEVVPFSRYENANPFLIVAGASFGAYHAANFGLRHPDVTNRVIGMSGLYDIRRFTDGWVDDLVYYNNPMEFIPYEHDPTRLRLLRQLDIILSIGRDDENARNNEQFSALLSDRGIRHSLRLWNGWAHDWAFWAEGLRRYVSGDANYP